MTRKDTKRKGRTRLGQKQYYKPSSTHHYSFASAAASAAYPGEDVAGFAVVDYVVPGVLLPDDLRSSSSSSL